MEEKTQYIIKFNEEYGDSFAKRAEMYYKKRPELINFVEESYKSYRALAERYDRLSTELQNANNTIASIFPQQAKFAMDKEEEYTSSRTGPKRPPESPKPNIPKALKTAGKDMKSLLASAQKKLLPMTKKSAPTNTANNAPKSGLNKTEALEGIEKLQKEFLALLTDKEFMRSSNENGLANVGVVIEDNEARTVMAAAALKSCQQTLVELEDQQERSAKEVMMEQQRIIDQANQEKPSERTESVKSAEKPKVMEEEMTDELQAQIRTLEDDKAYLIDGKNSMSNRLEEMESVKPDEELEVAASTSEIGSVPEVTPQIELIEKPDAQKPEKVHEADREVKVEQQDSSKTVDDHSKLDSAEQWSSKSSRSRRWKYQDYVNGSETSSFTHRGKVRANIDELLEDNLDFWLIFSTSFHQIQKFQIGVKDLQSEISKLKDNEAKKPEGTELTVWLEQSTVLKDELQSRFSNLCKIEEELSKALKPGAGQKEESKLTSYQAVRFQGKRAYPMPKLPHCGPSSLAELTVEYLVRFQGKLSKLKQDNNKVADELQVGLDHVTAPQLENETTLVSLFEEFGLSGSKNKNSPYLLHTTTRSRVPLRSFVFGVSEEFGLSGSKNKKAPTCYTLQPGAEFL
ncbi:Protein Networked (NET), actin-binding (NAB) domain [Dillenia turbinata]|uniref:Protein Networked (NET), actin-binding (NAB) domain n=1 Tax=Dillenia turbinata TaxID=194707 RepID=A0AAN8Z3W5_9MAGN